MHNMEKCGRGKGRPQGCSLRSHRRRRLAPLPPPFSPAPMLHHVVYASLLHFGVETADDYLFNYRPALVEDAKNPWLFPGAGESHKLLTTLSDQITSFIEKAIGLRLTVHQFRHLSAAIILKHQPGNYELVRLLLGHRTV